MSLHGMYVLYLPYWGGYQSKCACGDFESEHAPTRKEAVRLHTIHIAQIGIYA